MSSTKHKSDSLTISRRMFLSFLALLPLIGSLSIVPDTTKFTSDDDLILVDGWILKQKDLHAL